MENKKRVFILLIGILIIALISIGYAEERGYDDSENSIDRKSVADAKRSVSASVKAELDAVKRVEKKIEEKKIELKEKFEEKKEEIRKEFKERIENNEEKLKRLIEFKEKIKKNKGEFRVEGKNIVISEVGEEQREIIAGRINARTGLNLTAEDVGNGSLLRAILSNGKFADIKIMPDKASLIALQKLKAKCIERNCSVELKEVGFGNKTRVAWVVESDKDSRIFFIFKKRMIVQAEVDAESGKIIKLKKPWWAFLAKEKNADDDEIEEEIEGNETRITICHIPPGNAAAKHTITISERALKAHLAHGDFVGVCETGNAGGGNYTNVTIPPFPGNNTNLTLPPINESNFTIPGNNETNVTIPPLNNTGNNTEGNSS